MSAPQGYFAIQGSITFISGGVAVSSSTCELVGVTFAEDFSVAKLRDGEGNVKSARAHSAERKASFEIIPIDPSGNPATAASNVKIPDRLSIVTVSGTGLSFLDGTWNFVGPYTPTFSTDGFLKATLPCEKYCSDTLNNGAFAALT